MNISYLYWRAQTSGWSGYPSDQTDPRIYLDTSEYMYFRQEQLKTESKTARRETSAKMRRGKEVEVKKWQI